MPENLFREAKQLLDTKPIEEMSYEEELTVKAADIPMTISPQFNDMTTDEALEELARMVEGGKSDDRTIPRRD